MDQYDLWMEILADAAFAVRSKIHTIKGSAPGKYLFGRDIIIPIKHT